jgi:Ca2+-transporting ATPase
LLSQFQKAYQVCVSVALAIGMNKMAQLGCLVKGFAHVKTLGSVTDICTDKTGTFTTGRMAVVELCDLTNNYEFR